MGFDDWMSDRVNEKDLAFIIDKYLIGLVPRPRLAQAQLSIASHAQSLGAFDVYKVQIQQYSQKMILCNEHCISDIAIFL